MSAGKRYRPDPYAIYRCPYCNRDCKLWQEGIVVDSYMNVCHADCLPPAEPAVHNMAIDYAAAELGKALAAAPRGERREGIVQGREQVLMMLSDDLAKEIRDELESHDAALAASEPQEGSGGK
jgi:hypothetical protein